MTLQKKKTAAERRSPAGEGIPAIGYFLIEEEREGRASYSVLCSAEEGLGLWEKEAVVYDVTSVKEEGVRLLEALCRCRVTPYGLREAVEAWLS